MRESIIYNFNDSYPTEWSLVNSIPGLISSVRSIKEYLHNSLTNALTSIRFFLIMLGLSIIILFSIISFALYYIIILVNNLNFYEPGKFYLYVFYTLISYIVLSYILVRYMNVKRRNILYIYLATVIVYLYCQYYDACKQFFDISLFKDVNNLLIEVFNYISLLEINENLIPTMVSIFGQRELIVLVILGLLSYMYLFQYIQKRGTSIFEVEKGEGKFNEITVSAFDLYNNFNLFLFFILISYLVVNYNSQYRIVEIVIISSLFYINSMMFVDIRQNYKNIINSFNGIAKINQNLLIKSLFENILNRKVKVASGMYEYLRIIPFNANFSKTITQIIPAATFTLAFIGYAFKFNMLSIIYIELTLIIWYSHMSIAVNMPRNRVDLLLSDRSTLNDVYIVEERTEEHIVVIDSTNNLTKVMRSAIIKISKSTDIQPERANQEYAQQRL